MKYLLYESDPVTYKTFDGVEAGDMGAKCGWNGLDNGYSIKLITNYLSMNRFCFLCLDL